MTTKPPFFFEPEPTTTQTPPETVGSGTFFEALTQAGIVQSRKQEALPITVEGSLKQRSSAYLIVEYGVYKDDYSIHLTPCHDKRNLSTQTKVELAIVETLQIIKPIVPDSMRIDVFLPREDWKMKVISFSIRGAAKNWHFDIPTMEEAVMKICEAVQRVILK